VTPPFAEVVEVAPLLEAIWTSAAFGLAVVAIAAVGVYSSLRADEQRRQHHEGALVSFGAVTVACIALLVAAVVLGIWAMTQ
jgi:amino acid transporter